MLISLSKTETSPQRVAIDLPATRLEIVDSAHAARRGVERFIAARYESAFGASNRTDYPRIAVLFDAAGRISAAAGVRFADEAPLFLEGYLEAPIEETAAQALATPVARGELVEIGSFAARDRAGAILLFAELAAWLEADCGRLYAAATARPELERLLRGSGYDLQAVAKADPAWLGERAAVWGAYYNAAPQVFVGRIGMPAGLAALALRLQLRALANETRRASRIGA